MSASKPMTVSKVVLPLLTTVFFRPQNAELVSDNLWKPPSKEFAKKVLPSGEARKCIGQPDSHTRIESCEIFEYCAVCHCSTDSAEQFSMFVHCAIPLDQHLTKDQSQQLIKLSATLMIEVVVAPYDIYTPGATNKGERVLCLLGSQQKVNAARAKVQALLDLFGNEVVEYVNVGSPALFPVCAGVGLNNLEFFQKLYNVEVIMPQIWDTSSNIIFISGKIHSSVLAAKERLEALVQEAEESIYYSALQNMSTLKLLFLSKFRQRETNAIMEKHQCFIQLEAETVRFASTSVTALRSAMREFTLEALMPVFEAHVGFPDADELQQSKLVNNIHRLVSDHNVIIMQPNTSANSIVLTGNFQNISKCLVAIEDLGISSRVLIKIFIELDSEYKDFVSGKKSGKINRIMENAKCDIKLILKDSYQNMFITLTADSFQKFKLGISLLSDELPAEDSFFIPDAYHRPVIGTRGSVIQTIMRKYNVFIQFSNTSQAGRFNFGFIRLHNVIVRCPYKNRKSIPLAKNELKRIVAEYSELQPNACIRMSAGHYRYCFNDTPSMHKVISDIERKTGTYILFPTQIPSSDRTLEIRGNDQSSVDAARELLKHLSTERLITFDNPFLDPIDFSNKVVASLRKALNIEATLDGKLLRLNFIALDDKQISKAMEIVETYVGTKNRIKADRMIDAKSLLLSS
ncbi:LAFA_0D12288g1_1 [Lachancea sp. 'fantastica']|nr:LAFA_0D12288g1_1 [Lachancea sp. 'fantastica']